MKTPDDPTPLPITARHSSPAETRRGLVVMTLSLLAFTANTLLLKYIGSNRQIDPTVTLLFRAVIGGVIVLTLMRGRRPAKFAPIFREPLLIWRGILGVIGTASYYYCIPALGAGKASLLGTTYVLFGAVFAAWFLREYLSRTKVIWLLIAFGGTALLTGAGNGHADPVGGINPGSKTFYEAFAIIGAIAAAGTIVIIRHLTTKHAIATIFLAQCIWIGLAATPFAARHLVSLNAMDCLFLVLAATCAGYGQLAMNEGYRLLSVAAGSSVQMTLPVIAALGGILLFGEMYTALQVIGAVLILVGTWQVAVRRKT
jgi:drug/metabolite transporter (DMT)-like permease